MPTGSDLAKAGCPYLGTKYSVMDCQAFVEQCLADIGIRKNLAGSNHWFRFCKSYGWIGSPEECKAKFGSIPAGAFLFIHDFDGKEPKSYKDGLGNASHIGIYTAMTGDEMVDFAIAHGDQDAELYNYGNGAIHSSSSRGVVATSNFSGKTINGGWNKVGLWREISYGEPVDSIIHGGNGGETMTATVYADNGKPVNFRKKPNKSAALVDQIPVGCQVEVEEKGPEWSLCKWKGKTGYIMTSLLRFEDTDPTTEEMVLVNRAELEKVYDMIGNMLGERG